MPLPTAAAEHFSTNILSIAVGATSLQIAFQIGATSAEVTFHVLPVFSKNAFNSGSAVMPSNTTFMQHPRSPS